MVLSSKLSLFAECLDWESTLQKITGLDVNFYRAFISFNDRFVVYFQTTFISLISEVC